MNKITRKLRSRSGASMLIALVFMMFCVFIGGSVLAAASSNGYRVKHLSDQQQYLKERSAALLLSEEMTPSAGTLVKLVVYDTATRNEVVELPQAGGETVISSVNGPRTITFEAPAGLDMTAYQRLMFETSVWRYLEENSYNASTDVIVLKNFKYSGTAIASISEFWCQTAEGGTMSISAKKDGETDAFDAYEANYACGDGSEIYDFLVDFGDYSQLTVSMNGYANMNTQTGRAQYTFKEEKADGTEVYDKVSKVTEKTDIAWNNPVIEKGGAE